MNLTYDNMFESKKTDKRILSGAATVCTYREKNRSYFHITPSSHRRLDRIRAASNHVGGGVYVVEDNLRLPEPELETEGIAQP